MPTSAWAITALGQLCVRDGTTHEKPSGRVWKPVIVPSTVNLVCGSSDVMWIVTADGKLLMHRSEAGNDEWDEIKQSTDAVVVSIAASVSHVWVVDARNRVFAAETRGSAADFAWGEVPSDGLPRGRKIHQISACIYRVVGKDNEGSLYIRDEAGPQQPLGTRWKALKPPTSDWGGLISFSHIHVDTECMLGSTSDAEVWVMPFVQDCSFASRFSSGEYRFSFGGLTRSLVRKLRGRRGSKADQWVQLPWRGHMSGVGDNNSLWLFDREDGSVHCCENIEQDITDVDQLRKMVAGCGFSWITTLNTKVDLAVLFGRHTQEAAAATLAVAECTEGGPRPGLQKQPSVRPDLLHDVPVAISPEHQPPAETAALFDVPPPMPFKSLEQIERQFNYAFETEREVMRAP